MIEITVRYTKDGIFYEDGKNFRSYKDAQNYISSVRATAERFNYEAYTVITRNGCTYRKVAYI